MNRRKARIALLLGGLTIMPPLLLKFCMAQRGVTEVWQSPIVRFAPDKQHPNYKDCSYIVQQYLHVGQPTYVPADKWVIMMKRVDQCEHPGEAVPAFPVTAQDGLAIRPNPGREHLDGP